MSEEQDFQTGFEKASAASPITIEIDPVQAVALISLVQLACRHPGTRGMYLRQIAEDVVRALQDELHRRNADFGRLLERGWHTVFDVPHKKKSQPDV